MPPAMQPNRSDASGNERGGVHIVAELRSNHYGDRGRLERMIVAAKAAGADYVKLQKRDVETFYSPATLREPFASPFGTTFGDLRRAVELDFDDFRFVADLCSNVGIGWYASVLDQSSLEFMRQFDPLLIKVPSTVSNNRALLEDVARSHDGEVVVSTGMADEAYVEWVVAMLGGAKRLYLLQCTSAYPTPAADACIAVVGSYAALAQRHPFIVPGYSSHDDGWLGSALAVAAGARMVEKHVTLAPIDGLAPDPVALDLTTSAFRDYVAQIRNAELMLGSPAKTVRPSENHKYVAP